MPRRASARSLGHLAHMNATIITVLLALGFSLLYASRQSIRRGLSTYKWIATEGTITDSSDNSFAGPGLDSLGAGVGECVYKETTHAYVYDVNGRAYSSDNYCFGSHIDRAGAAYLIGTKVTIYYDPRYPEAAVLKRGVPFSSLLGLFPLCVAILYGLALLWLGG